MSPDRKLSRRDFIRLSALGAGSLVFGGACEAFGLTLNRTPAAATSTATATARVTATTPATIAARGRDIESALGEVGVKVDLKDAHPNFPRTHETAAAAISGNAAHPVDAAHMYPAIDDDKVFRGWWTYEAFEFQDGVSFDDKKGIHVDASGRPLTVPDQIFNFKRPLPVEKFADIKLNVPFAGVWAARRGLTRDGQPPQTYYYTGTQGTGAQAVEQAMLIPAEKDLCPDDWNLSAVTRAYRMAVGAFRDDPAARDGFMDGGQKRFIDVQWFNTIDRAWTSLDGRLVRRLAQERGQNNLPIIDKLVPNWPISPNDVTKRIGGLASKWFIDPETFEWFFEAFRLKVKYEEGVGHVDANGKLLVGSGQTRSDSQIFDFSTPESLASYMYGPGRLPAWGAVRTGGAPSKPENKNLTFMTYGNAKVIFDEPAIEQANITPLPPGCPVGDVATQELAAAKKVATEKNTDPLIKVFYWDGSKFVFLPK